VSELNGVGGERQRGYVLMSGSFVSDPQSRD